MSIGGVMRHASPIGARAVRYRFAFVIALVWGALHLLTQPAEVLPVTADSAKYDALARSVARVLHDPSLAAGLVSGRLAPAERDSLGFDRWEFQHAPGYVVPLGVLYAIAPNDTGAGRVLSLLLYALSAALLLRLADRLVGRRLAWLALGLHLLYLPFLYYGLGIATEGPSACCLLLVSLLLLAFHRREADRGARWLGLGLALLYLTKTTFRPIAILLLAYEAFRLLRRGARRRAFQLAVAAVAPVLLWTAILIVARVPANPIARTGEDALWAYRGNYVPDQGWETTGLGDAITPELQAASEGLTAPGPTIEEKDYATRRTMYWRGLRLTIARDPIGWLSLVATKSRLFWTYPSIKVRVRSLLGAWPVPRGLHLLLFPLLLLGIARCLRRRGGFGLPGLVILGIAGVHAVTHLVARYHLPVLPLAFVYAIVGAKGLVGWSGVALRRARAGGARRVAGWARWPALAALALALGGLAQSPPGALSAGTGRALFIAGACLAGLAPLALTPLLWQTAASGSLRARRRPLYAGALLLFCLPQVGARVGDPDWDAFAVPLHAPGTSLVQEIAMLEGFRDGTQRIDSAWVEVDMLRELRGSFRLEVRVGGEPVRVFADTLDGAYGAFLFDPDVHEGGGVYRKVADTYQNFVRGRLNPRWKAASPGFDYFRRWVRVPIPVSCLQTDTLRVELRLLQAEGGGVRIFGDRYLLPAPEGTRRFVGPVIGENPFEFSHYRAEFLAGDRVQTDARLIRPHTIYGPGSRSLRRGGGRTFADLDPGVRDRRGELRIRLRVRLPGQLAGRMVKGRLRPVWVLTPHPGDEPLGPQDLRRFQWWRDDYFDGTRVL